MKNRPSLGQISNVNTEVDELTSETCVLVWNGDQWVPMKLSKLNIGQGGGGQQQTILYYLRAVNQSPSTTLSASKSAGECAIRFMFVSRTKDVGQADYVDSGEWGTYEIFAKAGDGTFVSKACGRCQSNTITTVDVFKFLESGQNNITVKITGEVTGQTSPALVYSITLSALFLSISEFNWWKAYQGDIVLPCYISGNISKTLHVKITGEGYEQTYERQFGTATYTSSPVAYTVPFTNKTGIFHFSAWLSNEDNTIAYGTTIMRGARTDAGKPCEIVVDINGTSDQQLSVKSADYLLDIGDWSSYVINGALSIIGKRLKRLKLGDENEQKVKILISSLTLGNTTSLEEIDVQNISTLGGALDMRSNFRLRKFLAGGSSLTEAHFADGGALEEVDYPATTSYVELKNLDKLTNEKCNTEGCAPNVMSYFVSGCDNLQPIKMLIGIMDAQVGQVPHALRYVRCVGFNETFTDGRAFDKLSQLVDGTYQGIDAEDQYGNDPYPVFDGTINLTTGAYRNTYDALMTHYPKLKLNIAKWWIRFEDPEVKRICVENWAKDGDGELSMEEAAAVSSIGTIFRGNKHLKTLKDLRFFTSLDDDSQKIVANCPNLTEVWLPESMTFIGSWFSLGSPKLKTVVMCGNIPPVVHSSFMYINTYYEYPEGLQIFVPNNALKDYKQKWVAIRSGSTHIIDYIKPLSEYQG